MVLGAQQSHMWFVSSPTATSQVRRMTEGGSQLPSRGEGQHLSVTFHPASPPSFHSHIAGAVSIDLHGFHASASPHAGMHFREKGYLAIL